MSRGAIGCLKARSQRRWKPCAEFLGSTVSIVYSLLRLDGTLPLIVEEDRTRARTQYGAIKKPVDSYFGTQTFDMGKVAEKRVTFTFLTAPSEQSFLEVTIQGRRRGR